MRANAGQNCGTLFGRECDQVSPFIRGAYRSDRGTVPYERRKKARRVCFSGSTKCMVCSLDGCAVYQFENLMKPLFLNQVLGAGHCHEYSTPNAFLALLHCAGGSKRRGRQC